MSENTQKPLTATPTSKLPQAAMAVDAAETTYAWVVRTHEDPWANGATLDFPGSLHPYLVQDLLQTALLREEMAAHDIPLKLARRADGHFLVEEYRFGHPQLDQVLSTLRDKIASRAADELAGQIAELEQTLQDKRAGLARLTDALGDQ